MNYKTESVIKFFATPKKLRNKRIKDLAYDLGVHPGTIYQLKKRLASEIKQEQRRREKEEVATEVLLVKCQQGDVQAMRMYKSVTGRMDGVAKGKREEEENSYESRLIRHLADKKDQEYQAMKRELAKRTEGSTLEIETELDTETEEVAGLEAKKGEVTDLKIEDEVISGEVVDQKLVGEKTADQEEADHSESKVTKPKPTKPGVNKRKILNPLPAYRCELLEEMLAEDRRIEKEMKEGIRSDVGTIRNI